ncbi:MAG: DUF4238 domain-containing protein [Terriglobales bacterium]
MEKKKQHIIPRCYLKAWCDPDTPVGQTPYIWRVSKDGSSKRKKSPEKSFTQTDKYTFVLSTGERDLTLEDTLAGIEDAFVNIMPNVRNHDALTPEARAWLCLFSSAMHTRTSAMGKHWATQQEEFRRKVVAMEEAHGARPTLSAQLAESNRHAHQNFIATSLEVQTPMLFAMRINIFFTGPGLHLITSDTPCVWFNPEAYKRPPLFRHPGLMQKDIEVTLPLDPHHILLISHKDLGECYLPAGEPLVEEYNRRTRFACTEEFVSWRGEIKPYWFDRGGEPPDAWENTDAGKKAMDTHQKYRRWREAAENQDGGADSPNHKPPRT